MADEAVYISVRSVEAAIGERIRLGQGERAVSVQPGHNGRVIVWLEARRPAPVEVERDATTAGERAVTEEVEPVRA